MAEAQALTSRGRAVRLLRAGLIGGAAAVVPAAVGCAVAYGPQVLPAVALAAGVALLFFTLGQVVQVVFADADPVQVLVVSLLSYAVRVGGLAAFAVLVARLMPGVNALSLAITVIAVVIGWLAVEIWAFGRLRIPAFDSSQGKTD